ncbi:hypothetical protein G6F42_021807 [Rhizopus arrhizus]|nr:hypothetical protein G6F42_021807 [Rhizopus arrhizus]
MPSLPRFKSKQRWIKIRPLSRMSLPNTRTILSDQLQEALVVEEVVVVDVAEADLHDLMVKMDEWFIQQT